ncbi:MAG: TonB-dependent receptor [Sphingobacteriales bacterium]|nr:TonB-dependent receptor [Sphingobacteriales bacterium]
MMDCLKHTTNRNLLMKPKLKVQLNYPNMLKYSYVLILFFLSYLPAQAQKLLKVQGTVVDYKTSKPVENVTVTVRGMLARTAQTSAGGKFTIEVPSFYSSLIISYPGYQVKTFPLNGKAEVFITLASEDLDIGESVVRLPYYSINQNDMNGVYQVVSKGYDKTLRYRDIFQMLQGTVPGLEVNAYSGVPGEGASLSLGGVRSLYTTNQPLVIVDGIPALDPVFNESVVRGNIYNLLSDINVKDVESITVLRDAAATGIYGSRAANGVIIITTKEGTNGKSFLDVSGQGGFATRFKSMPVMNSSEYMPYLSAKINSQGLDQATINQNFPFLANNTTPNTVPYWLYANDTDWQKEVTRNALSQEYYMNLRGGDKTSKYSLNVGYNNVLGVGRGISSSEFTSRFNLDFRITPKFSAGTRTGFSRTKKNLMDQGYEERVNPLYLSLTKPSLLTPYIKTADGTPGAFLSPVLFDNLSNPIGVTEGVSNDIGNYWILGSVFANYQFNKDLTSKLTFSLNRSGLSEDRFTPARAVVPVDNNPRYDRTSEEQVVDRQIMTVEHTLTYNKQLNPDNRLLAFGGYNLEFSNYSKRYGYTIHSTSDEFQGLGDGIRIANDGFNEEYHNLSAFGNLDYTFREKLFVKAGVRLDGSSKFGENADGGVKISSVPFAVLPYTGLTWKLKAESWMEKASFLDELNLRASWGITANQDIPVNARYSLYKNNSYTTRPGIVPASIGNNTIKWETTYNYNIGTDISVLKKSLGLRLDYFDTKTEDLLVPKLMDGSNGDSYYWTNDGSISNRGFELGITTMGSRKDFTWKAAINVAKYKSKVLSLPLGQPIMDGENGYASIAQVGSPAGLIYGYKYTGVFSTTAQASASGLLTDKGVPYQAGDYRFEDLNGDNIINESDRQVIGDPNPKLFGGITTNLTYKNFGLDAVFSYSYGNEILNVLRSKMENGAAYENQSVAVLSAWQAEGENATIANTPYGDPVNNRRASSRYIEDGSYFKMRTITLSYNLNNKIRAIRNAQVYLSGYNLFTITDYLGWDPEVSTGQGVFSRGYDFGNYPLSRTFMVGFKLSL